MKGQRRNAIATHEAFADGWFKTGFYANRTRYRDNYNAGRIRDVIIRGTPNINPDKVAQTLYQHPEKNPLLLESPISQKATYRLRF